MKTIAFGPVVAAWCFLQVGILGAQAPGWLVFDQAHGELPPPEPLGAVAKKLGLEIQTSAVPITPAVLEGARVLYLRAPSGEFRPSETDAIVAFVKRGGALLVVLDEERRQSLEKTRVNSFISPFGMKLTLDTEYLHNNGAVAKAGEISTADRELPFSGGRAVEGGTPFAFQFDKPGQPHSLLGEGQRHLHGGSSDVAHKVRGSSLALSRLLNPPTKQPPAQLSDVG